jgi:hypothetical protein
MLTPETFCGRLKFYSEGFMTRDRKEYYKQYYKEHKEKNLERKRNTNKAYREKNKDKLKQKHKEYYLANKDTILARAKETKRIKYANNPQQDLAKQKQWKRDNQEKYLLQNARTRAKKYGVAFDLTVEDIVIPTHCPYLGVKLEPFSEWSSPSLDKINPELGYTKGNVQVISNLANTMKSSASIQQLLIFAVNVLRLHDKENYDN